jgi:multidrug resistance efflux pump
MIEAAPNPLTDPAGRAGADKAWVDRELWQQLALSTESEAFFSAWLELQCGQLSGSRSGLVLVETKADKTFSPAAAWPVVEKLSEALLDVARSTLDEGEAVIVDLYHEYGGQLPVERDTLALAYPLKVHDQILCVAAIEVGDKKNQDIEAVMRKLQWGASWLESFFLRDQAREDESTIERLVTALYMTAKVSSEPTANQSVTTFVTEMASYLDCERVSCGFLSGRHVKVESLSHTGHFGQQMNLVNAIGKAMDEALEQNTLINYPEPSDNGLITLNHEGLAHLQNGGAVLTIPLIAKGRNIGAICFESSTDDRFDDDTVQLCDSVVSVIGPIFRDKKQNDRWILTKLWDSLKVQIQRMVGPHYSGRKLALGALVLLLAFLYFAEGTFRITADTVLEGAEQRAVVAPYDAFVDSSIRRAGDRVKQGDVIALLDDTDLRLDLVELSSERAQVQSQYDEALAEHDRAKSKILSAKIAQVDAKISLVNERLKRTRLLSPIDGIIVKGDLSQSLGAAVSRGELLFDVSSLHEYRVNLLVDERDISYVQPGQPVDVVLSALPDHDIQVIVDSITPVTRAAEGRNYFNVEARLKDERGLYRPGMEGVSKISVGERRYVWIWTRELVNWLRLWSWRWIG